MKIDIQSYMNSREYIAPRGRAASVRYSNKRLIKAEDEAQKTPVPREEIIRLSKDFLSAIPISTHFDPVLQIEDPDRIDYVKIKNQFHLANQKDLIWMKFTQDGYLGVVAQGDDINFDIPEDETLLNIDLLIQKENEAKRRYTSSGILIHQLHKTWDKSFVLLFPLAEIPEKIDRLKIETGLGNYLLSKGVPILDYYSHIY